MDFDYIITATNAMYEVLQGELKPTQQNMSIVMTKGCNTLNRALDDRDLIYSMARQAELRSQFPNEFEQIVGDFNHFTRFFLALERQSLIQYGISPKIAKAITARAQELRTSILEWQFDPHGVSANIRRLGDMVCQAAHEVEHQLQEEQRILQIRRRLQNVWYGFAGLSVIVVNTAPIIGLSEPGTSVSVALGELMLNRLSQ